MKKSVAETFLAGIPLMILIAFAVMAVVISTAQNQSRSRKDLALVDSMQNELALLRDRTAEIDTVWRERIIRTTTVRDSIQRTVDSVIVAACQDSAGLVSAALDKERRVSDEIVSLALERGDSLALLARRSQEQAAVALGLADRAVRRSSNPWSIGLTLGLNQELRPSFAVGINYRIARIPDLTPW